MATTHLEGTKIEFVTRSDSILRTKFPPVRGSKIEPQPSVEEAEYWRRDASIHNADIIKICVIDSSHKTKKKFCCKRHVLVTSMRYFKDILEKGTDAELSVHCDISIFEWLLDYIHKHDGNQAYFELDTALSILISSDFLKMDSLGTACLQYISQNLAMILQQPIDTSCISDSLMEKIAFHCSPLQLSQLKLKKNKFLQRIYKNRIKIDFSNKSHAYSTCIHCGMLFQTRHAHQLGCPHKDALVSVSYNGSFIKRHSPLAHFSLMKYLQTLMKVLSWDDIYWHLWAASIYFSDASVRVGAYDILVVSALQTNNYMLHKDGLLLHRKIVISQGTDNGGSDTFKFCDDERIPKEGLKLYAVDAYTPEARSSSCSCIDITNQATTLTYDILKLLATQLPLVSNANIQRVVQNVLTDPFTLQMRAVESYFSMNIVSAMATKHDVKVYAYRGRPLTSNSSNMRVSISVEAGSRTSRESLKGPSPARSVSADVSKPSKAKARPKSASFAQSLKSKVKNTTSRSDLEKLIVPMSEAKTEDSVGAVAAKVVTVLCTSVPAAHVVEESGVALQLQWAGTRLLQQCSEEQLVQMERARMSYLATPKKEQLVMDTLREQDENRLVCIEKLLVGLRGSQRAFPQSNVAFGGKVSKKDVEKRAVKDYYKDKGRQSAFPSTD